jgi:LPXTG-motif cell wall-anchored protein
LGNGGFNTPPASNAGVVFGHLGGSHQDGRDIIPPFVYNGQTYSQNWDSAGQAIWRNGCAAPHDECDELTGTQPAGFPCSKQPETGKDTSEVKDCESGTVTTYETPWSQPYNFVPNDNGGSWVLGEKVSGDKVEVGSRKATLDECPRPGYPACPGADQLSLARLGGNTVVSDESPGCYEQKNDSRLDCTNGREVRTWTEFRPWVWNQELKQWQLGAVQVQNDSGWVFDRPLTSDEFNRLQCQPGQPQPTVKNLSDQRLTCAGGVEQRSGTQTTSYVWNPTTHVYDAVVGPEVWGSWTFVRPLDDAEFQRLQCQPGQPAPVVKPLSEQRMSCDVGVEGRSGTQTTTFVWNPTTRVYDEVVGAEVWGDWTFVRELNSGEIQELECVLGSESAKPRPHKTPKPGKQPTVLGTQAVAPTAVDAGLTGLPATGSSSNSLLAQLMVGGGLVLLLAGGWLGFGRREYGAHQA